MMQAFADRLANVEGDIGISYIDLTTGKRLDFGNRKVFSSSGLIMVMVLVECFKAMEEGRISSDTRYRLKKSDVGDPMTFSYGVLQYLHEDIELTVGDLCNLMVTVSDNVACNILMNLLGIDNINQTFRELGFEKMYIQRNIYDFKKIEQGVENYISVEDLSTLFERMYKGTLISEEASRKMLHLMEQHQKTRLIPDMFKDEIPISHISSFDDFDIADGGVVYAERPFILVMAASRIDRRKAEPILRDITKICYIKTQGMQ